MSLGCPPSGHHHGHMIRHHRLHQAARLGVAALTYQLPPGLGSNRHEKMSINYPTPVGPGLSWCSSTVLLRSSILLQDYGCGVNGCRWLCCRLFGNQASLGKSHELGSLPMIASHISGVSQLESSPKKINVTTYRPLCPVCSLFHVCAHDVGTTLGRPNSTSDPACRAGRRRPR